MFNLHNEIIELYNNGLSCTKIAKQLKITRQRVSKILKNNNIDITLQPNKIDLNESEVIELYKNNSIAKIADMYGVSTKVISRILKSNNIEIIRINNQKYNYHKDYFKNIDTEEKAYWLGFLYADGNVRVKDKYVLEIGLKADDELHLIKLANALGDNLSPKYKAVKGKDKIYDSTKLLIVNKNIVLDLIDKGCVPRKSMTLTFPNEKVLPKHLQRHFIRGYFDGDGSIYWNNNKTCNNICFNMLGTDDFLNKVYDILFDNLNITRNNLYKKQSSDCKFILKSGRQAYDILEWLYSDCNIYLDRKLNTFNDLKIKYFNRLPSMAKTTEDHG